MRPPTLRLRVKVTSPALPAARATQLPSVHADSQSKQPARPLLQSSRVCLHHSPFGLLLGAPSPLLCDVGPDRMECHVRPRPQGSVVRDVTISLRSEQGWTPHRAGGAPGIVTLGFRSPSSCVSRLPPAAAPVSFLFGASGRQSGGSGERREGLLAQLRGLHALLQSFLQLFRAAELLMEKLEAAWQGVERRPLEERKEPLREDCGCLCRRLPGAG